MYKCAIHSGENISKRLAPMFIKVCIIPSVVYGSVDLWMDDVDYKLYI